MDNSLLKIGITHGDYNGIGYEVILKVLADDRIHELFIPIIYGLNQAYNYYKKLLDIQVSTPIHFIRSASEAKGGMINMVLTEETGANDGVKPGESTKSAGILAARALMDARQDLVAGHLQAVVTAPINKDSIQSEQFRFSGHTEFFADAYNGTHPLMLFSNNQRLNVALLTRHIPLHEVSQHLSKEKILSTLLQYEQVLIQDFGIVKPRIAVLGLNPHAGENGLIGTEEQTTIIPAIQEAWERGVYAFGPYPADGFWGNHRYEQFDGILAMYHDQALIPFKLIAMNEGVNITAGLPVIRTSPDHGTAYDLVGKGEANPDSLRNAIYAAIDIYRNRKAYQEMTAHPLQKRYVERGKDNVKLDLSSDE